MKIVILQGSPNRNGSTSLLADAFAKGAETTGHLIERFDIGTLKLHPCMGCLACGYEGPCAQEDDNRIIRRAILAADMVVFATPLYYFGMTTQIKTVIDRFCAYNSSIQKKQMKSVLLTVAWNSDDWTFDALKARYQTLVRYCNFANCGMVLGYGCGTPAMTKRSKYVEQAYRLGENLR